MTPPESTSDLGRLLAFALDVEATPGSSGASADYARLVDRYREDALFRVLFDSVLEGAGCQVVAASNDVGLVIQTQPDGPWAWPARSADLPWNKFDDSQQHLRAARALVVVALLAYVAPSAADLDDLLADAELQVQAVGVRELETFIRDFCAEHEARTPDPVTDDSSRPLWWHWLQLPPDAPTTKRISRQTTTFIVHEVLSFLHSRGWLVDTTANRAAADKRYRPRRRLLHHYRDLLLDDVYTALRRYAEEQRAAPAAPATPATPADADGETGR